MQIRMRSAALNSYPSVARAVGLDPLEMLRRVALDASCLRDPDVLIPADKFYALMEVSARAANVNDFGLRLAQTRRLSNLGVIGLLIREEPTVRDALNALAAHIHLQNEGLFINVEEVDKIATIVVELSSAAVVPTRQTIELAVGVVHQALWELRGAAWTPVRVCFAHSAPAKLLMHHRMFGPGVEFEHNFNGIVCAVSDLDSEVPRADPVNGRYLRQYFEVMSAVPKATTSRRVRQLVWLLLPGGRCSIEEVADRLNMNRRTVHRHLLKAGETFSSIVQGVRIEVASRAVRRGNQPLCEVADLLGFSSLSGFCRWFHDQFGVSASTYRGTRGSVQSVNEVNAGVDGGRMCGVTDRRHDEFHQTDPASTGATRLYESSATEVTGV